MPRTRRHHAGRARVLADAAGVAWLALDRDGTVHTNARWRALPRRPEA